MEDKRNYNWAIGWLVGTVVTVLILAIIGLGINYLAHGLRNYGRGQKLADARNQVLINEIQIQQTHQLVQVQQQKAQIKVAEANGIAEAQRIINGTLTPLYLQHEAIQAQESQSNKIIYVPSGNQGIPLVQTVTP
jgi:hypothetical protein